MEPRDLLLVLLVGGAAWLYLRNNGAILSPDSVSNIPAEGGTSSPIFNLPGAPVNLSTPQADALAIINDLNAGSFGNWFDPADVMAFVDQESSFRPNVFLADRNGGSRGLMQIDFSAAQQIGFAGAPDDLYDPATNVRYGMAYLVWIWSYLTSHLGQSPTEMQWVTAYNAGVGNVVKGYADARYYSSWVRKRDAWASALAGMASA
jgi:soluble lytic murein transglycosylase-like protein